MLSPSANATKGPLGANGSRCLSLAFSINTGKYIAWSLHFQHTLSSEEVKKELIDDWGETVVSGIMSYAALAGFFTQKHPLWQCSPPSAHSTLIPLFFPFFITLPLRTLDSGRCWSQKMPKPEDAGVVTTPECSDPVARSSQYIKTSNFRSPRIEGSQGLIKQIPSNLVPFESYGPGKYASVDGIEGFGELGGLRWVRCCFYSFSIFTYLFHSFLHHFPINSLHSFCPLAGLRPIFTSYDFHVLF